MTHVAFGLDHKGPVTRPRTFGTTRGPVSASTAIVARVRREPQDEPSELLVNSKVLTKFFEKTTEAAAVAEQLPQRRGK